MSIGIYAAFIFLVSKFCKGGIYSPPPNPWRGVCRVVYFMVLFLWDCCRSIKQDLLVAFRNAGILIIAIFLGASLFLLPEPLNLSPWVCFLVMFLFEGNSQVQVRSCWVMEPTELVCPSEGFENSKRNEVSSSIFNGRRAACKDDGLGGRLCFWFAVLQKICDSFQVSRFPLWLWELW